ncbi:serine hydrolase [Natrarchaeobius chitinivorans]|uniref:Serine hydrolase n=1 Tax=Natrarchaeobius chitinivorans TaxID=1679083 RepID=A0A3N6NFU6_NATCH|nr:serine hydrolase [Natrarchaeobius chitinivorans]RQG97862.1 serine hydrolase [Natrarchaeobius chitinivorans]
MSNGLSRRRLLAGSALLGTATLAGGLPAGGRTEPATRPAETNAAGTETGRIDASPPPDIDLEGLESFVDERMGELLETHDVVGASVAVVHDGSTEHLAGYGEADADEGTLVDPEGTGFRLASVSKPIVWTVLMQLIEDGRIDPDEDVRTYLESVSIPETYDEPITVSHLATHTAGFEERFRGTWVTDADDVRPLPDVLADEQPERVRPPGEVASYSNYGTALAGQVVADVADTSFEEYVEERVFDPLGMETATFEQPVPGGYDADRSSGYTAFGGNVQAVPELFVEIGPAGGATATAADMARFVRAHLEGGALGEGEPTDGDRILESESVATMHEQWFSHHDALDGSAFGLVENERNGVRTLEHDGAIPGSFVSYLVFVPEYDLGVFFVANTNTGMSANAEFLEAFFDEYAPERADESGAGSNGDVTPDGPPERAGALEGTYRGVRIAESSHARLSSTLQAGTVDVSVDDDGYLVTDFGGGPERWVERDPLVFEDVDGTDTLAFREVDGEITHLFLGFHAYERISRHESLAFHGGVASATTLGMVSGLAVWPLAWGWRRFGGSDSSEDAGQESTETAGAEDDSDGSPAGATPDSRESAADSSEQAADSLENGTETDRQTVASGGETASTDETVDSDDSRLVSSVVPATGPSRARWLAGGSIVSLFGFVVGLLVLLVLYPYTLLSRPPLAYEFISVLALLGAAGTLAAAGYAVVAWREGYWGRLSRIHYTIVVASAIGFCWLLSYWNFLRVPF